MWVFPRFYKAICLIFDRGDRGNLSAHSCSDYKHDVYIGQFTKVDVIQMLEFAMMDEVTWGYIVLAFALLPWLWYAFIISFFVISLCYGRYKLYHPSDPMLIMDELPGVSILKPLMGLDPYLEYNLETHFLLKYPKV